jgi:PPK2 family polyphosphate:nucleotide phosphotransferase
LRDVWPGAGPPRIGAVESIATMFRAVESPYLVPFDDSFDLRKASTRPRRDAPPRHEIERRREKLTRELRGLQRRLYARDKHSVLLVFQAMDAAGKDGTIRAVMSGVDPAGFQVFSFGKPSSQELDHDFLWRTTRCLPERGRIGIFNRSYYEEVLVVRVHPEYLDSQRLPDPVNLETIWEERYHSIREHELHLARSGTVIAKFFLHVSKEEQRRRLLARLEEQRKRWKFNEGDLDERDRWDDYQVAFEQALRATSTEWAPWYAIPADDKPYMRQQVAEIVVATLDSLGLEYPSVGELSKEEIAALRERLAPEI